jgi:hypothetical protein
VYEHVNTPAQISEKKCVPIANQTTVDLVTILGILISDHKTHSTFNVALQENVGLTIRH